MCWLFVGILMVFSLVSCGVNLKQDEAEKIITEHFGFPKPVNTIIRGRIQSDFGNAIKKMIADKYVYLNPDRHKISAKLIPDYLPTEKGKEFINGINFIVIGKTYYFDGAVVKESLKSIDEILVDKESKEAIVKYTTKFEPFEPSYSTLCINERCMFFGENIHKENQRKIKLKKYDVGWRFPE